MTTRVLELVNVNDVVSVEYGERINCERIGRVIEKRDLQAHPLSPDTIRRRPDVQRSRFLVKLQLVGGEVRSMYAGNETASKRVTPLRRAWLKLAGVLPPKVV